MAIPVLGILDTGFKLIDSLFTSDEEKAEARHKLIALQQAGKLKEIEAAMNVIVAEAQSEHPLTSQWRPITMLMFAAIVGNNYLVYPYLSLFWEQAPVLDLPPDLWALLKIGIGGYVVGRSIEKSVEKYKA